MATRGTIAIENEDGSIDVVYSHWDNNISSNGFLLQKYYNTRDKVKKLISGGGISSLGNYVSDTPKSFDRSSVADDYTTYYTYRGEELVINTWGSFDDYEKNQQFEEYNYLYTKDNVWSVFDSDWRDLECVLQQKGEI